MLSLNKYKRSIQIIIEIGIVFFLINYFYENRGELYRISLINIKDTILLLMFVLIGNILRSFQLRAFINALGSKISFLDSIWVTVGSTLLNYIPMNFGMLIKARIMKKKIGIKYSYFASLTIADILITLCMGSLLSIIFLIYKNLNFNKDLFLIISLCVFIIIISIIIFIIPRSISSYFKGSIAYYLSAYLDGIIEIKRMKNLFLISSFVIFRLFLVAIQFFICFKSLGINISLSESILFSSISAILLIIPVTPGGIGFREVIVGLISSASGMNFEIGVLASSIYQVATIFIHISIGVPGLLILKRKNII
ncbi:MAG: hypothetical protein CMG55_03420 [Candidatus Marinimicrobia bacterium]|nr:hypothetical protein [Candidatus Neomarinimicrobiota bacterium]|tara:strand:- start:119 stop:1048 length:930 start_codon:yes stop_codon:yes gene_type:complete